MKNKRYWQSIEEKEGNPEILESMQNEFREELPLLDILNEKAGKTITSRRDFLKVLGFSVSAAALAASCEMPVRKSIPYVNKPEELTPGVALYYASTFADGDDYCSILVKTRDGRPIKIESNELSSLTGAGTHARVQGSILSLYDNSRIREPEIDGQKVSWTDLDQRVRQALSETTASGKLVVLLTSSIISPSTRQLIEDFKAKYPGTVWVPYNAVSYTGMLEAHQKVFGVRAIPSHDFSRANVIASFGVDFLGTWLAPTLFAQQYAARRQPGENMSRHFQFESTLTISGSNADVRVPMKPSQVNLALGYLYNLLVGRVGMSAVPAGNDIPGKETIEKLAGELWDNRGASLVVAGSNDPEVQQTVAAINNMLGNYGQTLDLLKPLQVKQGNGREVVNILGEMESGNVGTVIAWNCNPAYDLPAASRFAEAAKATGNFIAISTLQNETTRAANIIAPEHHYLESWGDAEPVSGHYSIMQPTIRNLFNTRQGQDSLLAWMADDTGSSSASDSTATAETVVNLPATYYEYLKQWWKENQFPRQQQYLTFQVFWDKTVHDGVFDVESGNSESLPAANEVSDAVVAMVKRYGSWSGLELNLYEKVAIGNGRYSDNPWLMEMPDPITRTVWDNYILVSPADAEENNWKDEDVLRLNAGEYTVELPVIVQPGQARGSVSVALGYGREFTGKEPVNNIGANAYPMVAMEQGHMIYERAEITLETTGKTYTLARTQTHHVLNSKQRLEERTIVREGILEKQEELLEFIREQRAEFAELNAQTLYPGFEDKYNQGHHWKMAIDLNSCIGCGACTVACQAENNVPVVGKEEVRRVHEMTWIRIDRYYTGEDLDNPDVVFQPMMCQHCDNAPCENVCPVNATNHSSEGLNQMAYNRCIGTRYCANNCPYKVRRFNWFDFTGADSFPANLHDPLDMTNDLTRMVLNPDVTVRSRGVMEKCSMCVQRIQEGKLNAKAESRPVKDGEIKTACMQACPTNAIVFGDINDKQSRVSQLLEGDGRTYYVIEEINTDPSVGYLALIRNRSEEEDRVRRGKLS